MVRRQSKVSDTRERLLEAGTQAFLARGYPATGVDDIVERAGKTRGAFYYYFASKQDMGRDLQEYLWSSIAKQAQDAFDPKLDIVTNIKHGFGAHLAAIEELGRDQVFLRDGFIDPTLDARGLDGFHWGVALVRDLLADAMERGEVRCHDPGEAACLLIEAFELATLQTLENVDVTPTLQVVDALLDSLLPASGEASHFILSPDARQATGPFDVRIFINDDCAYLAWVASNSEGYVINRQCRPSQFLTLHRAACRYIQGSRPANEYWTTGSEKVCGLDRGALEVWARAEVGQPPSPCRCCRG